MAITGGLDWSEAAHVFLLLQNYLVFGLNLCRQTFALSFSYSKFFLGDYDYSSDMC